MSDRHLVAAWLNDLATLTAGTAALADSKPKVAALADMLCTQFPAEAFTRASLEHIAGECTFFPAYGELRSLLERWWRDNKPPQSALPGPRLSRDDAMHVTVWLKRRNAGSIDDIVTSLSGLKSHKPQVFAHLVATDEQCRKIALQRRWLRQDDNPNDWDDLTEASLARKIVELEKLHAIYPTRALGWLGVLRKAVEINKPDLLHFVPARLGPAEPKTRTRDEQYAALGIAGGPKPMTAAELFEATHGRKPGELSREQIEAMRKAAADARAAAQKPQPDATRH